MDIEVQCRTPLISAVEPNHISFKVNGLDSDLWVMFKLGRLIHIFGAQISGINNCNECKQHLYRVSQEERTKLREGVPYVKLYRYNPKHLCPKLNGFRDNGKWSFKLWQLLHTYWLPNSYWNWQEYVVSVMLISVLNVKVTCEWHKPIKLNYKNTRTHVMIVLRVAKHCT